MLAKLDEWLKDKDMGIEFMFVVKELFVYKGYDLVFGACLLCCMI